MPCLSLPMPNRSSLLIDSHSHFTDLFPLTHCHPTSADSILIFFPPPSSCYVATGYCLKAEKLIRFGDSKISLGPVLPKDKTMLLTISEKNHHNLAFSTSLLLILTPLPQPLNSNTPCMGLCFPDIHTCSPLHASTQKACSAWHVLSLLGKLLSKLLLIL